MESENQKTMLAKDEITLKELILKIQSWIKFLISKWYILAFAGFVGGGLGYLYAKFKKPTYTASTTFVLESEESSSGGIGQMAGLAALAGVDLGKSGGGIFQGDNLFELYKSRKMIEAVLLLPSSSDSSLLLLDRYLDINHTKAKWKEKQPELLQIDFSKTVPQELLRSRDSILQKAVEDINKNYLKVDKLEKKLAIIKVDVKSIDEVFSKEFNEALVSEVNDFYVKTKTKKSMTNVKILQHKTDSVRAVMNGSIATAAVTIDATPNLNPTKQAQRLVPTQRSQFSAETNKAILVQLVQNLEMAKVALMKESPLIQIVDQPIYPLEKLEVNKLKLSIIGFVSAGILGIIVLIFFRFIGLVLRD